MLCVVHTVEHFSSNHQGLLVLYIILQKKLGCLDCDCFGF